MNISKEILNTIDGLGERFGVVIDWSKENVYPQVADLCERFIDYKLVAQWIWFAIFVAILATGIVWIVMMIRDRQNFVKEVKLSGTLGLKEKIKSRRNLYYCNYYYVLHKETGGYSTNEINPTLLGELSIMGICSCFIAGITGVICSLVLLIKLYIIPEIIIINYLTSMWNS